MQRMAAVAIGLGALTALAPLSVRADNIWEVENARANARAGGPTNANDRELLGRWGCLSGTNSAYCREIRHGANSGSYSRVPPRAPLRPPQPYHFKSEDLMADNETLTELDQRIAILRDNLRELVEQAAGYSGGANEELYANRISDQETRLAALLKEREALTKAKGR